jgi:hypothetical protein
MKFGSTRWYPVDATNKIVYLDAQTRKIDCTTATFPHCEGVHGFRLRKDWATMQAQGYTLKRIFKDRRGGAGHNQGRKFANITTVKLNINRSIHKRLMDRVKRIKERSGISITFQEYCSRLVLESNPKAIADNYEVPAFSSPGEITIKITDEAHNHLRQLSQTIRPKTPQVVSMVGIFTTIALMELKSKV